MSGQFGGYFTDSARFMALVTIGLNDAYIAVFDAKYHYNFWRPITAIRNGDIDANPDTDREATWQPIDNTPMHPEYPCAHCILSGTVAGIVKEVFGTEDIPEIAVTSPTAPGVTHHWTTTAAFSQEVADARIWAGFHYRFSTRVGTHGTSDRRVCSQERYAAYLNDKQRTIGGSDVVAATSPIGSKGDVGKSPS